MQLKQGKSVKGGFLNVYSKIGQIIEEEKEREVKICGLF